MASLLRPVALAFLLVTWRVFIPLLVSVVVYEHVLARTPGESLGAAAFEGERRALLAGIVLVSTLCIASYWQEFLWRALSERAGDVARSAVARPWFARRFVRAGLAAVALGCVAVVGAILLARHELYRVQTSSMLPVLKVGDEVAIDERAYGVGKSVRRGDLVRFDAPPGIVTDEPIRRVIGLPGDRIEMKRGGFPIVNGWEVPTCDVGRYFRWGSQGETNARVLMEFLEDRAYLTVHVNRATRFAEYVVPPGEVFVLADNRNAAPDSRNWKAGKPAGVPLGSLVGRVDFIMLSKSAAGVVDTAVTLRPPGLGFNLSGVDVSELDDGVKACLKARPKVTTPPKPGETSPEQTNAAMTIRP